MLFKDNKNNKQKNGTFQISICPICKRSGELPCSHCDGSGKIYWPGVIGKNFPCPECGGKGKVECFRCHGRGII